MINYVVAMAAEQQKPQVVWNLYSFAVDYFGIGGTDASVWLQFAAVLACIVIAYLLGSINPSIIFSKALFKDDIRNHGSGNAGTTNTLRTYGKKMALLIFVLDLIKAIAAVLIGAVILRLEFGGAIAGLFVILGHTFPVYYKFKGGKGVACLTGVVLIISPISFLVLALIFAIIVGMTKFVSLGSVICVMMYPLLNNAFYGRLRNNGMITFTAICIMVIVVFMHRENIKRIMNGTESKISISFKKKKEQNAPKEAKSEETDGSEE